MSNLVTSNHLESRVAKLETGLDMLSRDVASLAQIVRDQGNSIDKQLKDLAIGVNSASAPKKTDWQTLIAFAMLMLAIGSAVFWPLNQTAQDNKLNTQALAEKFEHHQTLKLHPVGQALLERLEDQLKSHAENNTKDLAAHANSAEKEFANLVSGMSRETDLRIKLLEQRLNILEKPTK